MGAAAIFAVIWLHPLFRDFSSLSIFLNSQTVFTEITYRRYPFTYSPQLLCDPSPFFYSPLLFSTTVSHWSVRLPPL